MIGSVKFNKQQYSNEEQIIFKSYYCSLCKNIRKRYGYCYSIFLSYDITFILILVASEYQNIYEKQLCLPFRNVSTIKNNTDLISFFSDLNMLSVYFKLLDDVYDQNTLKSKIRLKLFYRVYKKISNYNPELTNSYSSIIHNLFEDEHKFNHKDYLNTIYSFAKELSELSISVLQTNNKYLLKRIIYNIIFMIYINDAITDMKIDKENDLFNPILEKIKQEENNENYILIEIKNKIYSNNAEFQFLLNTLSPKDTKKVLLEKLFFSILDQETLNFLKNEG